MKAKNKVQTNDIVIAGFGGQGILFAGKVLAHLAMIKGKEVSWLPSYGPEMRGGTANCSVCINDEPIDCPLVTEPTTLIVMNSPSYDKFIDHVKPNGIAIIDSSLIYKKSERDDIDCEYVPATQLATENDISGMANIILLGKLIEKTKFAALDVVRKAFDEIIPKAKAYLIEKNMKAIQIGMEYGYNN